MHLSYKQGQVGSSPTPATILGYALGAGEIPNLTVLGSIPR